MDIGSAERRQHKRHKISCPITLFGRGGQVLAKANITDLSHGGTYVTVAPESVQDAESLNVAFSIPNAHISHQLEGFAANAKVIRQEPSDQTDLVGLALQFTQQMNLPIEA